LGRLWLDILPGIAVLLCGLVLAVSRNRAVRWPWSRRGWPWQAVSGSWWGPDKSALDGGGITAVGRVAGTAGHQVAQYMGYLVGLGAVISVLAGFAAGRLAARGARDVHAARAERVM
jgi:hypothetical protein